MSYDFEASSTQYGLIASGAAGLIPGLQYPYSIAIWFKPESTGIVQTPFSLRPSGAGTQYDVLRVEVDNKLYWYTRSTSGISTTTYCSDATVSAGTWYLAVAVQAAKDSRTLYLDTTGKSDTTDLIGSTLAWAYDRIGLGINNRLVADGGPVYPFDGKLAHAAVWDGVALTSGNVSSLYGGAAPNTVQQAYLSSYWPLNADEGTSTVTDAVGTFDIPLVNSPVYSSDEPIGGGATNVPPSLIVPSFFGFNPGFGR